MPAILTDPAIPAEELRQRLYSGDLVILTRLRALAEFVDYMRGELTELFAPYDPEHVHEHIEPAEMAKILGEWKPRWIHAERSRELVRTIIAEAGFDPGHTYYDVPKPRTSFPSGHLTTGIAFAFPWHRDVWYSAPAQQINWWLPVFPVRETNAMSFDLAQLSPGPVPNTSGDFDYYRNNAQRLGTAEVRWARSVRPVPARSTTSRAWTSSRSLPLARCLLFSGAQLHTSIPNSSGLARYSVDFRTVDTRDLRAGTRRATGGRRLHRNRDPGLREHPGRERPRRGDWSGRYYGAPPDDAMLVFSEP